ncbi:ComEA family DNA-binding protein [Algoriphagus sp.]|uniref:ComEA family DNA-binding protein n=1 Tax=Algoriphagus sp. TaxID=1872435 RepID=UPI00391AA214
MKSYLGFSRKESKGFILLIPFLILFGLLPNTIGFFKNLSAERTLVQYQTRLDSLRHLGIPLESSPLPTFNPQDTVKAKRNQKQIENLNRISFSETDSITLQIVPGIGQATAGRIIKYRENLGGFHSQNQLLEVYGTKSETISSIWDFFDFDSKIFRKININAATLDELAAHPYISYGEAKVLIAFRNQHGNFKSTDDLMKVKIFKSEWIEKIRPYLNFD